MYYNVINSGGRKLKIQRASFLSLISFISSFLTFLYHIPRLIKQRIFKEWVNKIIRDEFKKNYKKMRSQNKRTMKFSSSPIFHYIFRNSGLYASAFFALLKIHPTFINLLNLFLGAISVILVLIDTNNFKTAITLFLIAEFLDLTDGNLEILQYIFFLGEISRRYG